MSSESPLAVYMGQTLEPLPTELNADGKSLKALPIPPTRSPAYDAHPAPIRPQSEGNSFDFHGETRFCLFQCCLDLRHR